MEEVPTLGVKALLWTLVLVGAIVEVHPRCVWRDMRFREGYVLTRVSCGECTCVSFSSGFRWTCPRNVECEKRDVVLDCTYNGEKVEAGITVPKINDACANNCTCHVGGTLTCTNNLCTTPRPPLQNPVPSCGQRGLRRGVGEIWFPNPRKRCHSCECEVGGRVVCKDNCAHCYYNNSRLDVGDQVGSLDGCNTCTCLEEGRISCTEVFCGSLECVYEGRVYRIGDVFRKEGDCNLCDCGVDGQVECGTQPCPPPPQPPSSPQTPVPSKSKYNPPLSGAQPPPPPSNRQLSQPPSSPHTPLPVGSDHPDPQGPAPFNPQYAPPPADPLDPTPPSRARQVLQNNTCTFRGRSYKLGEQWAWHEGAGPQGPEGAWPGGKGSVCDKCTCVKDVDGTVTWVCTSVCTTSSPPVQERSLWSMVRELLASAFSRMSWRNV